MTLRAVVAPEHIALVAEGELRFRTLTAYSARLEYDKGRTVAVTVPRGFETDLGSVPRIFRGLISVAAAPAPFVLHDYLWRSPPPGVTARDADRAMRLLMRQLRQPRAIWARWLAYAGVRVGRLFQRI